jgi:hypothetical protein
MKKALIFLVILAFIGCKDDEAGRADAGKMMLEVDGVKHTSASASAIVKPATTATNPRASIEASFSSAQGDFDIIMSVSTQDIFKAIDVGEIVVEGEDIPFNYGIIYYSPNGIVADSYISFHVGEPTVGKIIFTQVDTTNKLISGTFECRTARKDNGKVVVLTKGSFTKIPYTE